MHKLSFTGTRHGMTPAQMASFSNLLCRLQAKVLVHGGCMGADAQAHAIATGLGMQTELYPGCDGNGNSPLDAHFVADIVHPVKPYLERDQDIVVAGEALVATPGTYTELKRSGTWFTVRFARRVDKTRYIIWPNGIIRKESAEEEDSDAAATDPHLA